MFFPFVSWYFNISTRKGKQKKENQITKKQKFCPMNQNIKHLNQMRKYLVRYTKYY
jgi:hypothetical protein